MTRDGEGQGMRLVSYRPSSAPRLLSEKSQHHLDVTCGSPQTLSTSRVQRKASELQEGSDSR